MDTFKFIIRLFESLICALAWIIPLVTATGLIAYYDQEHASVGVLFLAGMCGFFSLIMFAIFIMRETDPKNPWFIKKKS